MRGRRAPGGEAPLAEDEVEMSEEVLAQLEQEVQRPCFLSRLESAWVQHAAKLTGRKAAPASATESNAAAATHEAGEQRQPPSRAAEAAPAPALAPAPASAEQQQQQQEEEDDDADGWHDVPLPPALVEEGFASVDRDEAVQAMALYIALCLARHPEAQAMSPKQLQDALAGTFSALRQTKFRTAWRVGQKVYRWTTLGWSAVQMYQNPYLIQAVLTALLTASRVGARVFMP